MIETALRWLHACEVRPLRTLRSVLRLPRFWREYRRFKRCRSAAIGWETAPSMPCLHDAGDAGGTTSGHYFLQDLLVARRLFSRGVRRHVDVGSRVDGFVAHVAVFCPVEYFDLRSVTSVVPNIVFRCGDLTRPESFPEAMCDSLSCLHVLEHVGLGRYGDELNPDGWRVGVASLARLLGTDGRLHLSVPVGVQRVEFNAHRVFAPATIVDEAARCGLTIERFAWIDDEGVLHDPDPPSPNIPESVGQLRYGCGIFEFRRAGRTPDGQVARE